MNPQKTTKRSKEKSFKENLQECCIKFRDHFYPSLFWVCAGLIVLGIILVFFLYQLGLALVGFGAGLAFYKSFIFYVLEAKKTLTRERLFSIILRVLLTIFFLIVLPVFIIAFWIAIGVLWLIDWASS